MKEKFDIQKVFLGAKVVTRNGREATYSRDSGIGLWHNMFYIDEVEYAFNDEGKAGRGTWECDSDLFIYIPDKPKINWFQKVRVRIVAMVLLLIGIILHKILGVPPAYVGLEVIVFIGIAISFCVTLIKLPD